MKTKDQLTDALKEAMRDRDVRRKRTIRLALAAIKNAEIDAQSDLDEPTILALLQKEVKSRWETIEGAEKAGREDLIAEAKAELEILEDFLPKPLTEEELILLAKDAIAQTGARSPREMGQVMQLLMPKVTGRADGKRVSQIVKQLLLE